MNRCLVPDKSLRCEHSAKRYLLEVAGTDNLPTEQLILMEQVAKYLLKGRGGFS